MIVHAGSLHVLPQREAVFDDDERHTIDEALHRRCGQGRHVGRSPLSALIPEVLFELQSAGSFRLSHGGTHSNLWAEWRGARKPAEGGAQHEH